MDFGGALRALRSGKMVRRAGWNGKGMYLLLVRPHLGHSDLSGPDGLLPVAPSIAMRTAQGTLPAPAWEGLQDQAAWTAAAESLRDPGGVL